MSLLVSSEGNSEQTAALTTTYEALLLEARWAKATMLPFWSLLFPTYALAAWWMIYPVYYDSMLIAEWLPNESPETASFMMSSCTSAMFGFWMLGAVFWTRRADESGRKHAALGAAWGTLLLIALATGSWNFWSYAVMRSLLGLFIGGQAACAYIHFMEWSHPRDASLFTFFANMLFALALVLLAGFASLGDRFDVSWRAQILLLVGFTALPLCFAFRVLESPRWRLTKGQHIGAAKAILATTYGPPDRERDVLLSKIQSILAELQAEGVAPMPAPEAAPEVVDSLPASQQQQPLDGGMSEAPPSVVPVDPVQVPSSWEGDALAHLAIISASWFGVNLLYYGLDFAVGACDAAKGCDVYVNGVLVALADLPGFALCVPMADSPRFGRRLTLVFSFGLSALTLMSIGTIRSRVPDVTQLTQVVGILAFLGKCGAAAAFQIVYIYPAELFHAAQAGRALGIANVFGRIACILAPQAANVSQVVLNFSLGGFALLVSILALKLPETLPAATTAGARPDAMVDVI